MGRTVKKHHPRIEKFAEPIIIPRTGEDGYPNRVVHCTICDNPAYCRVTEDISSVIKVNYYCRNCVSRFLIAQ